MTAAAVVAVGRRLGTPVVPPVRHGDDGAGGAGDDCAAPVFAFGDATACGALSFSLRCNWLTKTVVAVG